MDAKYLSEIKKRAEETTPTAEDVPNDDEGYSLFSTVNGSLYKVGEVYLKSDAEFITHAHTDIKTLIEEVERLDAEVEKLDLKYRHYRRLSAEAESKNQQITTLKKALELACDLLTKYTCFKSKGALFDHFIRQAQEQEEKNENH